MSEASRADLPRTRMIGTDLDGTLLTHDGKVSAGNLAALARAEAAGIPVVYVTGRPPRWMKEVSDQTGHQGLAVCANGAMLYDLGKEEVVSSSLLSPQIQAEVAHALAVEFGDVRFAIESHDGFSHEDGYHHDYDIGPIPVAVRDRAAVLAVPGIKLLVRHHDLRGDDFLARAQALLGDAVVVTSSSGAGLLEISAAGVTKASGLAAVAQRFGISAAEVAVVGDMPNDLPMLAWAGRSFAVANAHPDVLEAADQIVRANADDGVADVIDRVLAQYQ
jgi:Cof subfamily protein (haloacid dehalogenase superfamily)